MDTNIVQVIAVLVLIVAVVALQEVLFRLNEKCGGSHWYINAALNLGILTSCAIYAIATYM